MAGKRRNLASDDTATARKRQDFYDDEDDIFTLFPEKLIRRLSKHLEILCCEDDYVFKTLRILNCNGADHSGGVQFPKAYCSVRPGPRSLLFGSIFVDGITMLKAFLKDRRVPTDLQEKRILQKLLVFISDKEAQLLLKDLEKFDETELSMILANHLYGKLATSSKYLIDKDCIKESNHCPCSSENCCLSGQFADTSIGNEEVWHGKLDIIVDNDMVGVSYPEYKGDNPGGKSTCVVKPKHAYLARNQQIISRTIVWSFLQKQRHPGSRHFLFPCIGVVNTGMVVYFYDSQEDVLLESSFISFKSAEGKVNIQAILASWFAINYKYLSSGIPHSKVPSEKASFLTHAHEKLEIYEHNLKFGNIGNTVRFEDDDSDLEVEPSDFLSETRWELLNIASL